MKHPVTARLRALRRHAFRRRRNVPGSSPGSLQPVPGTGDAGLAPARLLLLRYTAEGLLQEQADVAIEAAGSAARAAGAAEVVWLHLQGLPSPQQLQALADAFGLHPLALEDVLHRGQRAKAESYDAHQFVILNLVQREPDAGACQVDQVSLFLGRNFVVSIHDGRQDVFGPVRQRIRGTARIRRQGADYLLYALLDTIVDSGFPLLDEMGDELEALEDEILQEPDRDARNKLHYAKRELVVMRRAWWPQREVVASLMRDDAPFVQDGTRVYLRDCHDHCVAVIDLVENYREMTSSLLDVYLSSVSQRMNNVMKALTVVATIFLPLTFITGLYGMNFDTDSRWNMPELHWRFGYLYVLALMLGIVLGMLWYFRRKRWL
ncbi:magnesium transporter [Oryzisolibacter propanilivorax]|uniref:Magnesium transport protein CorA n=1 Tax=Oryzisolibacter propanilivorax TaxID=1527607 RepID=A0A1G9S0W9_9BURK|nr:magnesium/cobalt transporter CorA [Oryzisolibacter propanilivorax]SDM29116.1 magnesium transporter [Oryzisolibacter propanilivorax]